MRLVAQARAAAFGMISPNTSMTGVRTRVTTTGARPPSVGRRLHVAADAATMCATVTPIIAVESTRSGWRKASRYAAAPSAPLLGQVPEPGAVRRDERHLGGRE